MLMLVFPLICHESGLCPKYCIAKISIWSSDVRWMDIEQFLAFWHIGAHFSAVCPCLVCHQDKDPVLSFQKKQSKPWPISWRSFWLPQLVLKTVGFLAACANCGTFDMSVLFGFWEGVLALWGGILCSYKAVWKNIKTVHLHPSTKCSFTWC